MGRHLKGVVQIDMAQGRFNKGFIPQHRSVRRLPFSRWRLYFCGCAMFVLPYLTALFSRNVIAGYTWLVEKLLCWAGVVHDPEPGIRIGFLLIPSWRIPSFNPMADAKTAVIYFAATVSVLIWAIASRRMPFPARAWLGLGASMMLLTELVLFLLPVPRLTPEGFSSLWVQVAIGTLILLPGIWILFVGVIPVRFWKVVFWGAWAFVVVFLFSACRLAFFLSFAPLLGAVWLPTAFILGCSLLDILVMVVAFSRVMEKEGPRWEGRL